MTKWEYATLPLIIHATKQILDQWGEDGWELVQVITGPDGNGLVAYLQRTVGSWLPSFPDPMEMHRSLTSSDPRPK